MVYTSYYGDLGDGLFLLYPHQSTSESSEGWKAKITSWRWCSILMYPYVPCGYLLQSYGSSDATLSFMLKMKILWTKNGDAQRFSSLQNCWGTKESYLGASTVNMLRLKEQGKHYVTMPKKYTFYFYDVIQVTRIIHDNPWEPRALSLPHHMRSWRQWRLPHHALGKSHLDAPTRLSWKHPQSSLGWNGSIHYCLYPAKKTA